MLWNKLLWLVIHLTSSCSSAGDGHVMMDLPEVGALNVGGFSPHFGGSRVGGYYSAPPIKYLFGCWWLDAEWWLLAWWLYGGWSYASSSPLVGDVDRFIAREGWGDASPSYVPFWLNTKSVCDDTSFGFGFLAILFLLQC